MCMISMFNILWSFYIPDTCVTIYSNYTFGSCFQLKTKDKQIREQERQIKEQENNQVKMKKKFETQAQTLKMITQLSSELQNSQ